MHLQLWDVILCYPGVSIAGVGEGRKFRTRFKWSEEGKEARQCSHITVPKQGVADFTPGSTISHRPRKKWGSHSTRWLVFHLYLRFLHRRLDFRGRRLGWFFGMFEVTEMLRREVSKLIWRRGKTTRLLHVGNRCKGSITQSAGDRSGLRTGHCCGEQKAGGGVRHEQTTLGPVYEGPYPNKKQAVRVSTLRATQLCFCLCPFWGSETRYSEFQLKKSSVVSKVSPRSRNHRKARLGWTGPLQTLIIWGGELESNFFGSNVKMIIDNR